MEKCIESPQKNKIGLPYNPAFPLLGIYIKALKPGSISITNMSMSFFFFFNLTTVKSFFLVNVRYYLAIWDIV